MVPISQEIRRDLWRELLAQPACSKQITHNTVYVESKIANPQMVKLSIAINSDFYVSRQEDSSKQEIRSPESLSWIETLEIWIRTLLPSFQQNNPFKPHKQKNPKKGNYYSIKQSMPHLKLQNHCRLLSRASLRKHNAVKQYRRHRVAYTKTLFEKPSEVKARQMEVMNST